MRAGLTHSVCPMAVVMVLVRTAGLRVRASRLPDLPDRALAAQQA
jgi:hypothetical protein